MTGLTCARLLQEYGFNCTVYEKSRGLGGRVSTRRIEDGSNFDHGIPYINSQGAAFTKHLSTLLKDGTAQIWKPKFTSQNQPEKTHWVVGTPYINSIFKEDSTSTSIKLSHHVSSVRQHKKIWVIRHTNSLKEEQEEEYNIIVLALPAPQANKILGPTLGVSEELTKIHMNPCWALMLSFEKNIETDFDVWLEPSPQISWLGRNSSKPMRNRPRDCWVMHSTAAWAREFTNVTQAIATDKLCELLPNAIRKEVNTNTLLISHRWLYAFPSTILKKSYCANKDKSLFAGGDWTLGKKVEDAFASGTRIAYAIIEHYS